MKEGKKEDAGARPLFISSSFPPITSTLSTSEGRGKRGRTKKRTNFGPGLVALSLSGRSVDQFGGIPLPKKRGGEEGK